jgi:deazaflavin-dependent oxidoreductase (nitroreductase family)
MHFTAPLEETMSEKSSLELPETIPYPDNPIMKTLYKSPLLLYRLGLGSLIGKHILILTTTGRKSGKVRRTPVEYARQDGRIFVLSGFGKQPDWYRNLRAKPHVCIQTDRGAMPAIARPPESDAEWTGVYQYIQGSPFARALLPDYLEALSQSEILEEIKALPAITFDPTEEPCPPPLAEDLMWVWPLVLLGLAAKILIWWFVTRKS